MIFFKVLKNSFINNYANIYTFYQTYQSLVENLFVLVEFVFSLVSLVEQLFLGFLLILLVTIYYLRHDHPIASLNEHVFFISVSSK